MFVAENGHVDCVSEWFVSLDFPKIVCMVDAIGGAWVSVKLIYSSVSLSIMPSKVSTERQNVGI